MSFGTGIIEKTQKRGAGTWALLFAAALLSIPFLLPAEDLEPDSDIGKKTVLFVSADRNGDGNPWYDELISDIRAKLQYKDAPFQIGTDLMSGPVETPEELDRFCRDLTKRLERKKYDVVVFTSDDIAGKIIPRRANLGIRQPLVALNVRKPQARVVTERRNVTGTLYSPAIGETANLAVRIFPDFSTIAVVIGGSDYGRFLEDRAKEEMAGFRKHDIFYFNDNDLTTDQLISQLEKLPAKTLILYTDWRDKNTKSQVSAREMFRRFNQKDPHPIFAVTSEGLSHGLIGGKLVAKKDYSGQISQMIQKVLSTGNANDVPFQKTVSKYYLDHDAAKQFHANLATAPNDTIYWNMSQTLGTRYRHGFFVPTLALFLALLALGIFWMLLHNQVFRLKTIIAALPTRFILASADGQVFFYHLQLDSEHFQDLKEIKRVSDLPPEIGENFLETARMVAQKKQPYLYKYTLFGKQWQGEFRPVSIPFFSRDCVLWTSTNISGIHELQVYFEENAKFYRSILNSMTEGIIIVSRKGPVTFLNPEATRLTGYDNENSFGCTLREIFRTDTIHVEFEQIKRIIFQLLRSRHTPVIKNRDFRVQHRNGTIFDVSMNLSMIQDSKTGKIVGMVLTLIDRTRRCEEERLILAARQRYRQLEHLAKIAHFHCGKFAAGIRMETNNPGLWKLDSAGNPLPPERWILSDDIPQFHKSWETLLNGSDLANIVFHGVIAGSARTFRMLVAHEPESKPEAPRFVGIIQDITGLLESKDLLSRTSESGYLTSLGLEIRTLLDIIFGRGQLIAMDAGTPELVHYAEEINSAGNAMLQITNDVLEFRKNETDQKCTANVWLNPKNLLLHTRDDIREAYPGQPAPRIHFLQKNSDQIPELYLCADRFRKCFLFLSKALLESQESGVPLQWRIEILPRNDFNADLFCTVSRTVAQGNPQEQLAAQKPLQKIYRLMASQLVEKQNGEITFSAEPNALVFTVKLNSIPFRNKKPIHLGIRKDEMNLSGNMIWVVDDMKLNCNVMTAMLSSLHAQAEGFDHPDMVLKRLEQGEHPDLILIDLWMPVINGCELVDRIMKIPHCSDIPFIAVSADVDAAQNFDVRKFSAVLLKPVTLPQLQSAILSTFAVNPMSEKEE